MQAITTERFSFFFLTSWHSAVACSAPGSTSHVDAPVSGLSSGSPCSMVLRLLSMVVVGMVLTPLVVMARMVAMRVRVMVLVGMGVMVPMRVEHGGGTHGVRREVGEGRKWHAIIDNYISRRGISSNEI